MTVTSLRVMLRVGDAEIIRPRFRQGAEVPMLATVLDQDGAPVAGATVALSVVGLVTVADLTTNAAGEASAVFDPVAVAAHVARASVTAPIGVVVERVFDVLASLEPAASSPPWVEATTGAITFPPGTPVTSTRIDLLPALGAPQDADRLPAVRAGDGGSLDWLSMRVKAAEYTPPWSGAQTRSITSKVNERMSLLDFIPFSQHAAILDETTTYDAAPAIATAIAAAVAEGIRDLRFPRGLLLLASASPLNSVYGVQITGVDGLRIRGAGQHLTRLQVANNTSIGTMAMSSLTRVEISDMTLDGNRLGQTAPRGHGLRGQILDTVAVRRVTIQNTAAYGIGFQSSSGGVSSFRRMLLEDVQILEPGNDGIDFKNEGSLNAQNRWVRVHIRNPSRTAPATGNAAFDIRGPVDLHQCIAEFTVSGEIGETQTGFRVRNSSDVNGEGGRRSNFSQCRTLAPVGDNTVIGFGAVDPNVALDSCVAENCGVFGFTLGNDTTGTNLRAFRCRDGFRIGQGGGRLVAPQAIESTRYGFWCDGDTNSTLIAPSATGGEIGLRFEGGSVGAVVTKPAFSGQSITAISGTSTGIRIDADEFNGDIAFYIRGLPGVVIFNRGEATHSWLEARPNVANGICSWQVRGTAEWPNIAIGLSARGNEYVQLGNETNGGLLRVRAFGTPTNRADIVAGSGLGAASVALIATPTSGSDGTMWVAGTGAGGVVLGRSVDRVGFYGIAGIAKPSIVGSRGGNSALADLLARLAAMGLITDSTTG